MPSRPPFDPDDVRRLHALEQLGGVASQMAGVVAAFYHALVREGLPSPEAATLASVLLRAIVERSAGDG